MWISLPKLHGLPLPGQHAYLVDDMRIKALPSYTPLLDLLNIQSTAVWVLQGSTLKTPLIWPILCHWDYIALDLLYCGILKRCCALWYFSYYQAAWYGMSAYRLNIYYCRGELSKHFLNYVLLHFSQGLECETIGACNREISEIIHVA